RRPRARSRYRLEFAERLALDQRLRSGISNASTAETERACRSEHVTIVGPYLPQPGLVGGSQMDRVPCTDVSRLGNSIEALRHSRHEIVGHREHRPDTVGHVFQEVPPKSRGLLGCEGTL